MHRLQDIQMHLRKLSELAQGYLQDAAAAGDFEEVAAIASIAQQLTQLDTTRASHGDPAATTNGHASDATSATDGTNNTSSAESDSPQYPRFARDDGSLVKLGWSPRSKAVYRHRVDAAALKSIISSIAAAASASRMFKVADVAPQQECDGLPSYQLTTAVGWLKHVGLLVQHGKRGYTLAKPRAFKSEAKTAFELLPLDSASPSAEMETSES